MNTNKKTWIILLILTLVAVSQVIAQTQSGTTPDGFQWQIEGYGVTITDYTGSSRTITIPAAINGRPVRTIGEGAFFDKQLINVSIPNSVTSIEYAAFADNQLANITIPNSVNSIGNYAFRDNQLTSVSIPNSVTSIRAGAFMNNSLTSVTIPNSVNSIGRIAFSNNLLPSITLGANIVIANDAFVNEFTDYYNSQERRAGTYTWSGTAWSLRQ